MMVAAADKGTVTAVDIAPGSAHDGPLLAPVLRQTAARVGRIDEVVGDKAFDGRPQREACARRGAKAVVPAKSNRVDPEPLDEAAYRERNRVERLFAKLKEFRRVATRYEKLKVTFRGWVQLVFGFIRLRAKTKSNVNRARAVPSGLKPGLLPARRDAPPPRGGGPHSGRRGRVVPLPHGRRRGERGEAVEQVGHRVGDDQQLAVLRLQQPGGDDVIEPREQRREEAADVE